MNKTSHNYQNQINRPLNKKGGYKTVSIFSGILGIEIGLDRAGFDTVFALDFDNACKEIIEENNGHLSSFPYVCTDINKLTPEEILQQSGFKPGEIDLLAGGPPCQSFSKSGLRKGVEDEKGMLFKRYLDYLDVMKPKAFLLENVRGLYSSRKGEDFKLIKRRFKDAGYTLYWKILDAANYGIPQFRQRLFLVGFKDRKKYSFPIPSHGDGNGLSEKPFVNVEQAFSDLDGDDPELPFTGKYKHLLEDIPEGMNYSFYTEERGHPDPIFKWRSKFWYFLLKIDRTKPSLTIQAYPGNNTGPFHWENRRLSVGELKRLQTFPDWFKINKSYRIAHRVLGNAVPPLLAEVIGNSIAEALSSNEKISESEYEKILENMNSNGHKVKSGRGSGKGRMKVKRR